MKKFKDRNKKQSSGGEAFKKESKNAEKSKSSLRKVKIGNH